MKKYVYLFLLSCFVLYSKAQNTDSLKQALGVAKHDTIRCEILMQLIENENDDLIWPRYNQQLQLICKTNLKRLTTKSNEYPIYTKFLASSYSNQGYLAGEIGEVDSSLKYNQLSIDVLESLLKITKSKELVKQIKIDIATSLNNIATNYTQLGDKKKTIEYIEKSLKIQEELNDKVGIARSLSNLAFIYDKQGDIPKALEYNHKSLKIKEAIGDKDGISNSFNNMGTIYVMQNEYDKALSYFQKAHKIQKEINNKNGIPQTLSNIAYIYLERGDSKLALKYYYESLELAQSINDLPGVADVLGNIGSVYYVEAKKSTYNKQADSLYDLALKNYDKALAIHTEIENKSGIATTLINISEIYYDLKNIKLAKEYGERAYKITNEIGQPYLSQEVSAVLSKVYNQTGNYKLAYEMMMLHKLMSDSINNESTKRATLQKSFQYEYDKKAAADSVRVTEERKVTAAQLKQEKTQRFALYGGLALVIAFSAFVFNRFRITQKQKAVIENQKLLVDEKNEVLNQQKHIIEEHQKEIIDSITYAKRIQDAILPPSELIKSKLPQSFVLYKPKDIVAGDFYWMEQIGDTVLIAAADCTGHGVPGAMVSVVCSNALNRAVKEFYLSETGAILDKVTDLVLETFEKSVAEVKDGMDISLLSINMVTKEIKWSGANNPLWYICSSNENKSPTELVEVTADKQPIGKSDHRKPFTTHILEFKQGITFYLFTDGYADQFGGPKGKKYKYKQFQETLMSTLDKELSEQQDTLNSSFERWKGSLEQVDDVCIIGIRL
ncbi:MAG: tetratricopeptide repeat protein [Bacteroidetes bacterium]|nr:tetratricopeptide repeat protein [Bacteroidota bacterium]